MQSMEFERFYPIKGRFGCQGISECLYRFLAVNLSRDSVLSKPAFGFDSEAAIGWYRVGLLEMRQTSGLKCICMLPVTLALAFNC